MNRRTFIKSLSILGIDLLTQVNCFPNTDPELKEVFEYITLEFNNLLNQYDKNILIKKISDVSIEGLSHRFGYCLVQHLNKKYNLHITYYEMDWNNYNGWLLVNNPYMDSLFDKKHYQF